MSSTKVQLMTFRLKWQKNFRDSAYVAVHSSGDYTDRNTCVYSIVRVPAGSSPRYDVRVTRIATGDALVGSVLLGCELPFNDCKRLANDNANRNS